MDPQKSAGAAVVVDAEIIITQELDGALRALQARAPRQRSLACAVDWMVANLGPVTRNTPHVVNRNEHGNSRNGG